MLAQSGCLLLFVSRCLMSGEGRAWGGRVNENRGVEVLAMEAFYLTTRSCEVGGELFYLK